MTNLNSYTIENYLYKLGNEYSLNQDTMKIESIINVNNTIFFFCSKKEGFFQAKISETKSIASTIIPVNALIFHNLVLKNLSASSL